MAIRPVKVGSVLLAVGCWVGGCAKPEVVIPPVEVARTSWTYAGAPGVELQTEHYRIRTTCTHPPLLAMLPEFLEACWEAYARLIPPRREVDEPAVSYLFQTRGQWERFTQEFSPARASTYLMIRSGGYEERGTTVSHYDRMATTLAVMAHEGLHQFLSVTRGGRIPAWVNEGLACYYEAFDIDDRGRPMFQPRKNLIRRNNLRDAFLLDQLFDFRELLSTNAGRVVSLPASRVRSYYAQAWSVVLFLLEAEPQTDPSAAGFRDLLRELGSERMALKARAAAASGDAAEIEFGEAVFRAYVTEDLEGFERRYARFVRDLLDLD